MVNFRFKSRDHTLKKLCCTYNSFKNKLAPLERFTKTIEESPIQLLLENKKTLCYEDIEKIEEYLRIYYISIDTHLKHHKNL